MGITSDRETPQQLAGLIHHEQPSASFRLDLAVALLRQLGADFRNNGFPNAAQVLALGEAATADAAGVGSALDHALARREALAVARLSTEDVSLVQARAEVPEPALDPVDATLDTSRSRLALGRLEDAAEQLDHEGASR